MLKVFAKPISICKQKPLLMSMVWNIICFAAFRADSAYFPPQSGKFNFLLIIIRTFMSCVWLWVCSGQSGLRPLLRSTKVVKVLLASLRFLFNCKILGCSGLWTCGPTLTADQWPTSSAWFGFAAGPRQGKLFMAQVEWGKSFLIYLLEQTILYGLMMIINLLPDLGFMSSLWELPSGSWSRLEAWLLDCGRCSC